MRTHIIAASLLLSGLTLSTTAFAQHINVRVNGELVPFAGQQPVEEAGSVLVPLRGVFEKLGATVAYDYNTRTVLAIKESTSVSLKLGSTTAAVNGQPENLSRPAQAVNGTTLVPLRFVSEALGAQVRWNDENQTVLIDTNGAIQQSVPPAPARDTNQDRDQGELSVNSLTHDARGPLHAGQVVTVTLTGTPYARASFSIQGIEQAQNVPMRETQDGTYVGSFTVPEGVTVRRANMTASLRRRGRTSPTIQAERPITIGNAEPATNDGPWIHDLSPMPNSTLPQGRPVIQGTLSPTGAGIRSRSVRILLNGDDVTEEATITDTSVSFKPDSILPLGRNTVTIIARDRAGNETRKAWTFNVVER